MADFLPSFFRLAVRVDAQYDALSRKLRQKLGIAPPLRILPYRGYGTPERAVVKARVLEDRHVRPPQRRHTLVGSAVASYKRYMTREVPGARNSRRSMVQPPASPRRSAPIACTARPPSVTDSAPRLICVANGSRGAS